MKTVKNNELKIDIFTTEKSLYIALACFLNVTVMVEDNEVFASNDVEFLFTNTPIHYASMSM